MSFVLNSYPSIFSETDVIANRAWVSESIFILNEPDKVGEENESFAGLGWANANDGSTAKERSATNRMNVEGIERFA